jgi:succinate dehydrogenase / fumarate reductase, iron-sulfur subunit
MNFSFRIWRQQNSTAPGKFVAYQVKDVTPDMSFLEMLDALNEDLLSQGNFPLPSNTTVERVFAARVVS